MKLVQQAWRSLFLLTLAPAANAAVPDSATRTLNATDSRRGLRGNEASLLAPAGSLTEENSTIMPSVQVVAQAEDGQHEAGLHHVAVASAAPQQMGTPLGQPIAVQPASETQASSTSHSEGPAQRSIAQRRQDDLEARVMAEGTKNRRTPTPVPQMTSAGVRRVTKDQHQMRYQVTEQVEAEAAMDEADHIDVVYKSSEKELSRKSRPQHSS